MHATITKDFPSDIHDASISGLHAPCDHRDKGAFFFVTRKFWPAAITTAIVAVGASTNYSGDTLSILSVVTPKPSETDMSEDGAVTVLPDHFVEAYEEMRGYSELAAGWDGIGSVSIPERTIRSALSFLAALPAETESPEPGATADGHAEWYWRTANGIATVSFNDVKMSYYVRADGQKVRGSSYFDGASLPSELITMLLAL